MPKVKRCVRSWMPVKMLARLAAHIDVVTNIFENRAPLAANRSSAGVFKNGCPAPPSRSQRWSSERKKRILGRSVAMIGGGAKCKEKVTSSNVVKALPEGKIRRRMEPPCLVSYPFVISIIGFTKAYHNYGLTDSIESSRYHYTMLSIGHKLRPTHLLFYYARDTVCHSVAGGLLLVVLEATQSTHSGIFLWFDSVVASLERRDYGFCTCSETHVE